MKKPGRINNITRSTVRFISALALGVLSLAGCSQQPSTDDPEGKLQVVTTTTMITDLLHEIGGEHIELNGLMGSGVDPHLYKATEGDLQKLTNADAIFYNGLHLEGKLAELLEQMGTQGKSVVAVADAIDEAELISSDDFAGSHDPHIWFDSELWNQCARYVAEQLAALDPDNQQAYQQNLEDYLMQLDTMELEVASLVDALPINRRILITAHDAFSYFGRQHNFDVRGLMGISTASEAGIKDVQNLAAFIVDNQIKAIFVESSVSSRSIEALQAAVRARDFETVIGGELFSDATGTAGTPEGTYIGMYRHNAETVVSALK